jgi:hypothetical protein
MSAKKTVGANWIRHDGEQVTLTISRCGTCDARWFPPGDVCSRCASSDVHEQRSANRGVVYASTVVRAGPARYRPPYVLAYVDIDGIRLLAHAGTADAPAPGTPVRLMIGEIGGTEDESLMSYVVTEVNE